MTSQETDKPGKAGAGRWTKIVLVVSLALNLFVAAIFAGAAIKHRDDRHHDGVRDIGMGLFTDVLTPDDRSALRDAFVAAAPDLREERRRARADIADLAEALRADPYDPARLEALLGRYGDRFVKRIDLGGKLLGERLAQMTPAERAALADRIEDKLEHGRRH